MLKYWQWISCEFCVHYHSEWGVRHFTAVFNDARVLRAHSAQCLKTKSAVKQRGSVDWSCFALRMNEQRSWIYSRLWRCLHLSYVQTGVCNKSSASRISSKMWKYIYSFVYLFIYLWAQKSIYSLVCLYRLDVIVQMRRGICRRSFSSTLIYNSISSGRLFYLYVF